MAARGGLSVARRDKFMAPAANWGLGPFQWIARWLAAPRRRAAELGRHRHPGLGDEILYQPRVDLGQPVAMAADRPPDADDIDAEPAESLQMAGPQRAGQSRRQAGGPGGDKKARDLGLAQRVEQAWFHP